MKIMVIKAILFAVLWESVVLASPHGQVARDIDLLRDSADDVMHHVLSFNDIPSIMNLSLVNKYFRDIVSLNTEKTRDHLSVYLPSTGEKKTFFRLSEEDVLNELPTFESVAEKLSQVYAETKLLSILDARLGNAINDQTRSLARHQSVQALETMQGFFFDSHLPNRSGWHESLSTPDLGHILTANRQIFVERIESILASALREVSSRGSIISSLESALDLLADEDYFLFDDNAEEDGLMAGEVITNNLPAENNRNSTQASESWLAEKEFIDFTNKKLTEIYDRFTSKRQCGDLLHDEEFRVQIKKAIGIEIRNSQYYANLVGKKAIAYESYYQNINDSQEALQPLLNNSLSEIERSSHYMRLCKSIMQGILRESSPRPGQL